MDTPLVSICTIAYNHAPFIRQCMDGVLMQKTSFPVEFLIHDDASADETADMIREYETSFPDVIKAIYQTENQFSKGAQIWAKYLFPKARGKYIALCDGDDYWTDPLKLQKQVDFLETHPDYAMCGGKYRTTIMGQNEIHEYERKGTDKYPNGRTVTFDDFFDSYLFYTLTVCFRREYICNIQKYKVCIDDTVYCAVMDKGKGFLFPDYFAMYRLHPGGVNAKKTRRERLQFSEDFYKEMLPDFGSKSKSLRKRNIRDVIDLRFIDLRESKHFFRDYFKIVHFALSGKSDTFLYGLSQLIEKTGRYTSARVKKFFR
jgi:glycosyltransferase involved in cell wall biosynthesis